MTSIRNRYLDEISNAWGYIPAWLPNRTVRLGDVGPFIAGGLDADGSLASFGIDFRSRQDANSSNLEYRTAKAVSIEWQSGVGLPSGESAELEINFARESALVVHLHAAVERRIDNLAEIKQRILELDRRSGWPSGRAVVVSVVHATNATVLISASKDARVRCEARVGEALGNLADPRLELRQTAERSMHTTIVSKGELTPLYQAMVLRRRPLGGRNVESAVRGHDNGGAASAWVNSVVDEDFTLCHTKELVASAEASTRPR